MSNKFHQTKWIISTTSIYQFLYFADSAKIEQSTMTIPSYFYSTYGVCTDDFTTMSMMLILFSAINYLAMQKTYGN